MATTSTGGAAASASAAPAPALKALRRLDYTPVNYTTKTVNLDFNIKAGVTRVQATLGFEQLYTPAAGETAARPLVLHRGSTAVQTLVSVAVEGAELSPADYALDEKTLTLTPPAGATAFTVKIVTDVNPEANTSLEGLYKSGSAYSTQVRSMTAGPCSRFRAALHCRSAECLHGCCLVHRGRKCSKKHQLYVFSRDTRSTHSSHSNIVFVSAVRGGGLPQHLPLPGPP
jgi:hypothetical protein